MKQWQTTSVAREICMQLNCLILTWLLQLTILVHHDHTSFPQQGFGIMCSGVHDIPLGNHLQLSSCTKKIV